MNSQKLNENTLLIWRGSLKWEFLQLFVVSRTFGVLLWEEYCNVNAKKTLKMRLQRHAGIFRTRCNFPKVLYVIRSHNKILEIVELVIFRSYFTLNKVVTDFWSIYVNQITASKLYVDTVNVLYFVI